MSMPPLVITTGKTEDAGCLLCLRMGMRTLVQAHNDSMDASVDATGGDLGKLEGFEKGQGETVRLNDQV